MWLLITDLSAASYKQWVQGAEKKIKTVPHSAKSISITDMIETRTILRTISEQLSKTWEQRASAKIYWFYKKNACVWSILGVISYCCCYEYF